MGRGTWATCPLPRVGEAEAGGPGAESLCDVVDRHRAAEIVDLVFIASMFPQKIQLGFGFHSYSQDSEIEPSGHADDGGGNGGVVGIDRDVANEERSIFSFVTGKWRR